MLFCAKLYSTTVVQIYMLIVFAFTFLIKNVSKTKIVFKITITSWMRGSPKLIFFGVLPYAFHPLFGAVVLSLSLD